MVVEVACECDDLPPHSHLGRWDWENGSTRWIDTGEVRIWVDWKAVARAMMEDA